MSDNTSSDDLVPTTVLYDVMHETATRIRSVITRRYLEDKGHADRYIKAQQDLLAAVDAVPVRDRDAILKMTAYLRNELEKAGGNP